MMVCAIRSQFSVFSFQGAKFWTAPVSNRNAYGGNGATWAANLGSDPVLGSVQTQIGGTLEPDMGLGALKVLGTQFYEPPAEFLPQGESSNAFFRQIHVGVSLNYANTTLPPLYAGAKPGALMLTRPPVVFVHGINSGPSAWQGAGGTADAMQSQGYIIPWDAYVNHSMSDGGMGPLTQDWSYVENSIETTVNDFHLGYVASTTDGGPSVSTGILYGTPIAVQKVDVVAHSYGGLLTRWYMEQATNSSGGKLFEDFRNIRSLIELGTPNLGSPLANMIDEVYSGTALGQTIGNAGLPSWLIDTAAFIHQVPSTVTTVSGFLAYLQELGAGGLPTTSGGNPYPFYEDDAVDSPLLGELNAGSPFNDSVSYAAVYGTDTSLPVKKLPNLNIAVLWLNVYADMQPIGPNNQSYFPWINTFDGAANDAVVPEWSDMLPVQAYDMPVNTDHIDLESNASTEADVVAFLANPGIPLGSAEAKAADAADPSGQTGWNAPVSDQNAYFGGANNNGPGTEVYDAGLNPEAVVGVQLDGNNDYNAATWNLGVASGNQAGAGIKHPVLTGMVQKSQLEGGISMSLVASSGGYDSLRDTLDTATVRYGGTGVYVDANAWAAAGPGDYVPLEISTLEMGRGLSQGVTGPSLGNVQDDSGTGYALVGYTLGGISSPTTQVNLPTYTPPAPVVIADVAGQPIQVQVEGAFQVTDATAGSSPTSYDVKLYDTSGDKLYEEDVSAASEPTGIWNGLALEFTPILLTFGRGSNNTIIAPDGFVLTSPANILQNFWESGVTSSLGQDSTAVEIL